MKIKFVEDMSDIELLEVSQSHCPRVGEMVTIDCTHTITSVRYVYGKNSMSSSVNISHVEVRVV